MHNQTGIRIALLSSFFVLLLAIFAYALDYPHSPSNYYGCVNCHDLLSSNPYLMADWTGEYTSQDPDDTPLNHLCRGCHNDTITSARSTHSYYSLGYVSGTSPYGPWQVQCTDCHDPHYQKQFSEYRDTGDNYWQFKSLVDTVTVSESSSTLKAQGTPGWTTDEYENLRVVPNVDARYPEVYKITGNNADTLTIKGQVNTNNVESGDTFAVIYGKLIRDQISLARISNPMTPKTEWKMVKFFRKTGDNSCVDGDAAYDGVCEACHTDTNYHRNKKGGNRTHNVGTHCMVCHGHDGGFKGVGGTTGGHPTHLTTDHGPQLTCSTDDYGCHGTFRPDSAHPLFEDGENFANTEACDNCHGGPDGGSMAKTYWPEDPGTWMTAKGEGGFCGSCHDVTQGNTDIDGGGDVALNVMGDDNVTNDGDSPTYGFLFTGHGKASGNYSALSWQDNSAAGNPAANRKCSHCHDLTTEHFNNGSDRLKAGYANDAGNSNCNQCHKAGGAESDPDWYTTYAAYQNSAHNSSKCSDCHDVHGASGANPAMTKNNQETLCYQCHSDSGGVMNNAVSGAALADDIEDAFALGNRHNLGTSFTNSSKNYTLECISCHNVHIITGKYWEADSDKSPVTRFTDNTQVWGAAQDQKMKAYADTGKYQKPSVSVNTYNSDKLPDYSTFCLDCHSSAIGSISAKNWGNDPHGKKTAGLSGMISGGGVDGTGYAGPKDCPDWKGCGRAFDWGSDRPSSSGSQNDSFPVIPRGAGTGAFVEGGYLQTERNAGVNYVLSCTDCHEAHGSVNYSMLRLALNRAYDESDTPLTNDRKVLDNSPSDGTKGLCMQCHNPKNTREHSYNPGWHNNYVCATGPCHQPPTYNHPSFGHDKCYGRCHSSTYVWDTNLLSDPAQWATFHENRRKGNNSQTVTTEPGLVFNYKFENNLKDSGTWNLHGISFNGAASYVSGKVGNAIVLDDRPIEVGTEEYQWGSNEYNSGGPKGNTSKLTEMKYNTSIEAWVYPTSDPSDNRERKIAAKNTYWTGGYTLVLRPVSGQYRVGYVTNMGYGGPTTVWDTDSYNTNGLRGAYSSVDIPLNEWTHVAATFDANGPYGDLVDPTAGKIRIYVNGEDVTTSDLIPAGNPAWAQPQDPSDPLNYDEEFMTPEPIVGEKYPSRAGGWLASVLSLGGLNWTAPNDNFIGRLDEARLWYITKDADYFDGRIPPMITKVVGQTGYDKLLVELSEEAYSNTDGTGALDAGDFVFTDSDNSRTITGVQHIAGSSNVTLTLSSAFDSTNDIGTDSLAFSGGSVYDELGDTAGFTDVVIVVTMPSSSITSVEGTVGSDKLKVNFLHWVYGATGKIGSIESSDLLLTDSGGDNPRTISAVQHGVGDAYAIVTMSAPLAAGDVAADSIAAAGAAIFDSVDHPVGTASVAISAQTTPTITGFEGTVGLNQVLVLFSEGIYADTGQLGTLAASDFALTDTDNTRTITAVDHTAGAASALLTLSSAIDSSADIGTDTLAASGIYNSIDSPVSTTPVTLSGNNCPIGGTTFNFSESAGSSTVADNTGLLSGTVIVPGVSMLGDGMYTGDVTEANATAVDVKSTGADLCLKTPRAVTLESRFYMSDVDLDYVDVSPANGIDDDYDVGIIEGNINSTNGDGRNATFNRLAERQASFLITIMRASYAGDYIEARKDKARVEFKYITADKGTCDGTFPNDPTGEGAPVNGSAQKQISSDIDNYPIVTGHWYKVRIVFNTDKSRNPVDIFGDDQGTDGNGAGELWTGYKNIAKSDPEDSAGCKWAALPGIEMKTLDRYLFIGDNCCHTDVQGAANNSIFKGKVDWFSWKPVVDYSGVDDPPH